VGRVGLTEQADLMPEAKNQNQWWMRGKALGRRSWEEGGEDVSAEPNNDR
jgi:hypothetical protein